MNELRSLARSLSERWRHHDFDERVFPRLASSALEAACLPERVSPTEVLDWLVRGHDVPAQHDSGFGQPPVLVYNDDHFYIEVLFWLEASTSLHAHGFSGAFQVLAGSSLHSTYTFHERRRVNSRFRLGEIRHLQSERLAIGSVRPITLGDDYIHSLYHLDHPSVSVVVRTHGDADAGEQREYHAPHVAYASFEELPLFQRQLAGLRVLQDSAPEAYLARAEAWIGELDLERAFYLMRQCHGSPATRAHVDRLDARLRAGQGEAYFDFRPTLTEEHRQRWLTRRRQHIKDPRQRHLLALLLNVPRLATLLELVGGEDPVVEVRRVLGEILADRSDPSLAVDFDEGAGEVLERLLRGLSDDGVHRSLCDAYEEVDADDVRAMCGALRSSLLFSRVLGGTEVQP